MEVRRLRFEAESLELINIAHRKAKELGHSYVGSVHLLLALMSGSGCTSRILRDFGLDATVTEDLAALLYRKGSPHLPLPQGLSTGAGQILRGAAKEAMFRKGRSIHPVHILLSLVRRENTAAGELLLLSGIDAGELFTKTVEDMQWQAHAPAKHKKEVFQYLS